MKFIYSLFACTALIANHPPFKNAVLVDSNGYEWHCHVGIMSCQMAATPPTYSRGQQDFQEWLQRRRGMLFHVQPDRTNAIATVRQEIQQPSFASAMADRFIYLLRLIHACQGGCEPKQQLLRFEQLLSMQLYPPYDSALHNLQERIIGQAIDGQGVLQPLAAEYIQAVVEEFLQQVGHDSSPLMMQRLREIPQVAASPTSLPEITHCSLLKRLQAAQQNPLHHDIATMVQAIYQEEKSRALALRERLDGVPFAVEAYNEACKKQGCCWPYSPVVRPSVEDGRYVSLREIRQCERYCCGKQTPFQQARRQALRRTFEYPTKISVENYQLTQQGYAVLGLQAAQYNSTHAGQPIQHQLWHEAVIAADALGFIAAQAQRSATLQKLISSTGEIIQAAWQATEQRCITSAAALLDHVGICNEYSMAVVRGIAGGVGSIVHMLCHPVESLAQMIIGSVLTQLGSAGIAVLYCMGCCEHGLTCQVVQQAIQEFDHYMLTLLQRAQHISGPEMLEMTVSVCTQAVILHRFNTACLTAIRRTPLSPIRTPKEGSLLQVPNVSIPAHVDVGNIHYKLQHEVAQDIGEQLQGHIPKLPACIQEQLPSSLTPVLRSHMIRWAPLHPAAEIVDAREYSKLAPLCDVQRERIIIPRYGEFAHAVLAFRKPLSGLPGTKLTAVIVDWEHIFGIIQQRYPQGIGWKGGHVGKSELLHCEVIMQLPHNAKMVQMQGGGAPRLKSFFDEKNTAAELMQQIVDGYERFVQGGTMPQLAKSGYYEFTSQVGTTKSHYCINRQGVLVTVYPE